MSGHIVMVTCGVMCDVGQSAPTGGLLIGAEHRGFPPVWSQLDSGHWTRSTT